MARGFQAQPLRYQIREKLISYILAQGCQPGDSLPPEAELAEVLGVRRFSLREALLLLEEERVIATRHGSGRTLVSVPDAYQVDITSLQSVTELLAGYDIEATNQVLRVSEAPVEGEISASLGLDAGAPVLSIERVRYANDTPIIYSIDCFEKRLLPEGWSEADLHGSLFSYLEENCGIELDHSQATIRATQLPEDIRRLLNTTVLPWTLLEQVIYNRQGEPVVFSSDYHRGDALVFHLRRFRR